jgi:hypothetical protein
VAGIDHSLDQTLDRTAQAVFTRALRTGRAGELLNALFHGAGATIDAKTGDLVILEPDLFEHVLDPIDDHEAEG